MPNGPFPYRPNLLSAVDPVQRNTLASFQKYLPNSPGIGLFASRIANSCSFREDATQWAGQTDETFDTATVDQLHTRQNFDNPRSEDKWICLLTRDAPQACAAEIRMFQKQLAVVRIEWHVWFITRANDADKHVLGRSAENGDRSEDFVAVLGEPGGLDHLARVWRRGNVENSYALVFERPRCKQRRIDPEKPDQHTNLNHCIGFWLLRFSK